MDKKVIVRLIRSSFRLMLVDSLFCALDFPPLLLYYIMGKLNFRRLCAAGWIYVEKKTEFGNESFLIDSPVN